VSALALLFGLERFAPKVPGGLVALLLGIVISGALDLAQHGVAIVGDVPSGLPSLGIPDISRGDVAALMVAAAGMLLVIFSESLGAAETFAAKHGYEIDPNQELIALGAANVGSGLVGGLAGGGSLSQSAVNDGAGARSEVSPLVASVLVVITVLFLTPLFKNLPEAVLAALIIFAVSHLWKIRAFKRYFRVSRVEFWLGLATLVGVLVFDVLPGLLIGVIAMLVYFIYQASTPHVVTLGRIPGVAGGYGNVKRHPDYEPVPDLLVLRLEAPLFYANASGIRDLIKKLIGASDPLPRAVILDAGANDSLDITSDAMLAGLVTELRSAGIDFALAEVRHAVAGMARRSRLLELLGKDRVFDTVEEAVATLEKSAGTASPSRPS
jgi:MFS superfamily sulfate permease-like transporter